MAMISLTLTESSKLSQFTEGEWQQTSGLAIDSLLHRGLIQPKLNSVKLIEHHETARQLWNGRGSMPTMAWVIDTFQEYQITRRGMKARGRAGVIREQDRSGKWLPLQPKYSDAA